MFALSGINLPSLRSYAAALKHYEGAPEQDSLWRGLQKYDGRRLGSSKRDMSKRIRKDGDGTLSLRYHHTDLVRWHPDNSVSLEFHGSASSQTFTSCFIPNGLHCVRRRDSMYIQQTDGLYLCESSDSRSRLRFKEFEPGVWACVNPHCSALFDGYTIDRKRMAAVQKKLRGFMQWRRDVNRLTGTGRLHRFGGVTASLVVLQDIINRDTPVTMVDFPTLRDISEKLPSLQLFMRHAYVLGHAVKKESLPLGSLPKESPYGGLASWQYV